jgi:hypothetical protein
MSPPHLHVKVPTVSAACCQLTHHICGGHVPTQGAAILAAAQQQAVVLLAPGHAQHTLGGQDEAGGGAVGSVMSPQTGQGARWRVPQGGNNNCFATAGNHARACVSCCTTRMCMPLCVPQTPSQAPCCYAGPTSAESGCGRHHLPQLAAWQHPGSTAAQSSAAGCARNADGRAGKAARGGGTSDISLHKSTNAAYCRNCARGSSLLQPAPGVEKGVCAFPCGHCCHSLIVPVGVLECYDRPLLLQVPHHCCAIHLSSSRRVMGQAITSEAGKQGLCVPWLG